MDPKDFFASVMRAHQDQQEAKVARNQLRELKKQNADPYAPPGLVSGQTGGPVDVLFVPPPPTPALASYQIKDESGEFVKLTPSAPKPNPGASGIDTGPQSVKAPTFKPIPAKETAPEAKAIPPTPAKPSAPPAKEK
jgi:hypothetical protein